MQRGRLLTSPAVVHQAIVFFSHRLAAFPQAEQVVVIDAGRIVEQGTHAALLTAGGLYARIYRAQQRVAAQEVTL